jgi:hypothetical protein
MFEAGIHPHGNPAIALGWIPARRNAGMTAWCDAGMTDCIWALISVVLY